MKKQLQSLTLAAIYARVSGDRQEVDLSVAAQLRAMRAAAARSYFLGSKAPFGYTRVKVSDGVKDRPALEVDPVAVPIVREIFRSSKRGNGLKEICKELNGRGIANWGRRCQTNIVHYLLTNEAYNGTAVWGARARTRRRGSRCGWRTPGPPWCPGGCLMRCSRASTSGCPQWRSLRGRAASTY